MTPDDRSPGERAVEQTTGESPAESGVPAAPQGILFGAGGDPLILGLPIFVVGSLALGFALVGVVPTVALGAIIPIISAATAFGQFVSARWAMGLGQSIVACIFGIFTGFWGSLTLLLLGITHGWFGVPVADVAHTELLFYISWDIVIFFLLIPVLRLPMVYIAVIGFIVVALTLVVLGLEFPGSTTTFFHLAGIAVFVFLGFGSWAFLNVSSVAMGGPPQPPLGPPLLK